MRSILLIIVLILSSCKPNDYLSLKKVAKELGCSGTIGIYRTTVKVSQIYHYKKYFELHLDCPDLFQKFDTTTLLKVAAYRLYLNLNDKDKKDYPAIRVVFKNDFKSTLDTSNFFKVSYLKGIYDYELKARKYMQAIKDNDKVYLTKAFDKDYNKYTDVEIDSINNSFYKITKGEFNESRLYNWSFVNDENMKFILLVFLTGTENNYSTKFQFAFRDSIMDNKNIVSIKYK